LFGRADAGVFVDKTHALRAVRSAKFGRPLICDEGRRAMPQGKVLLLEIGAAD
jgi:hypothetical protein